MGGPSSGSKHSADTAEYTAFWVLNILHWLERQLALLPWVAFRNAVPWLLKGGFQQRMPRCWSTRHRSLAHTCGTHGQHRIVCRPGARIRGVKRIAEQRPHLMELAERRLQAFMARFAWHFQPPCPPGFPPLSSNHPHLLYALSHFSPSFRASLPLAGPRAPKHSTDGSTLHHGAIHGAGGSDRVVLRGTLKTGRSSCMHVTRDALAACSGAAASMAVDLSAIETPSRRRRQVLPQ